MLPINELIQEIESESLDFKQEYHRSKSKLIYDILCLLNSDAENDRYIVFGVAENKSVFDIASDENRKTAAEIIDLLRNKKINRLPHLKRLSFEVDNKAIDVLIIKNTRHKPYFLTEDFEHEGFRIPGGKIVTRVGDANTPANKSAEDHSIEKMYLERFGLHLSPLERVKIYLKDIENWKSGYNEKKELFYYYSKFPEFTFSKNNDSREEFEVEEWVYAFPDSKASSADFYLKYDSTILEEYIVVSCDGARFETVLPEMKVLHEGEDYYRIVYFIKDTEEYLLNKMIQKLENTRSVHYIDGYILEFESVEQRDVYLSNKNNFIQGPSFFRSVKDLKRFKVLNGEKIQMLSL